MDELDEMRCEGSTPIRGALGSRMRQNYRGFATILLKPIEPSKRIDTIEAILNKKEKIPTRL